MAEAKVATSRQSDGPPSRNVPSEVMQLMAVRAKKSSASLGTASTDGHSSTGSGPGVTSVTAGMSSVGSDAGRASASHASSSSAGGRQRQAAGETAEQRAKRKAAEAALAAAGGETPEQRAKRKAAEAAALARRAQREAEKKQQEKKASAASDSFFGLYEGLPAPDPEKDAQAARLAELASKQNDVPKLMYKEDRSKIIFLDIDGVVRPLYGNQFSISSIQLDGENVPIVDGDTEFIPTALTALRIILEQTGAAMVLSSEWRRHPTLRDGVNTNLKKKGLPAVIDDTPLHDRELTGNPLRSFAIRRAREIGAWLKTHPEVRQWVALDDIDLGQADDERQAGQPLLTPRLVLTDKSACLTKKDAQVAINILSGRLNKPRVLDDALG